MSDEQDLIKAAMKGLDEFEKSTDRSSFFDNSTEILAGMLHNDESALVTNVHRWQMILLALTAEERQRVEAVLGPPVTIFPPAPPVRQLKMGDLREHDRAVVASAFCTVVKHVKEIDVEHDHE